MTKRTTKAPVINEDDNGTSDECPEPYGFFADADQCDKYWVCTDGQITGNLDFCRVFAKEVYPGFNFSFLEAF